MSGHRLAVRAGFAAALALLAAGAGADASPAFRDEAAARGLRFHHFNGMTGRLHIAEMMGPGIALLDYDGDGDLDVLVLQGGLLAADERLEEALEPPREALPLRHRLFRNDLEVGPDGRLEARFVDVTDRAGLAITEYGMGVAVGDYDGDGLPDLYLAQLGDDRLLRNRGDGTFEDVTAASGAGDPRWSVAATFADLDGDGRQDLYVVSYLDFEPAVPRLCAARTGAPDYCGPLAFRPLADRLLRSRGDGTFEDAGIASGVGREAANGMGVVAADLDGDRRTDLFVANDAMANFLWINGGGGTFADGAALSGVALSGDGVPEGSMGIAIGDADGDGTLDLFLTHLTDETNTLYLNEGGGLFRDATQASGLGNPSWPFTGFGTAFLDYDNDGWLDLLVVNGAVNYQAALNRAVGPLPPGHALLAQRDQLFRNLGNGRFAEVPEAAAGLGAPAVSRGAAFGDVDNDGATDVAVADNGASVRLLINRAGAQAAWLGVRVLAASGGDAVGALLELHRPQGPPLLRHVHTDGSYASASDSRVRFGLGTGATVERLEVRWPDGATRILERLPVRRYLVVPHGGPPRPAASDTTPEPAPP